VILDDSLLMPVCGQTYGCGTAVPLPASCVQARCILSYTVVQGSCREIRSLSNTLSHVCSGHVQRVYVYQTDSSVDFIL